VILAAGVLKLPDLAGPLGDGIRGQVLAGIVSLLWLGLT
jgi:undecaprenyl-diphosphatase